MKIQRAFEIVTTLYFIWDTTKNKTIRNMESEIFRNSRLNINRIQVWYISNPTDVW